MKRILIVIFFLLLTSAGWAQPEAQRVVEAMATFMERMGNGAQATELRDRWARGRLTFGPTQSGDNAEAQPGVDMIRFHTRVFEQMVRRDGTLDQRAVMSWAGTYLHERVHVGQDRAGWAGSTWQEIFGLGNRSETQAWKAGFQAYLDWFNRIQEQRRQPGLSLREQADLANQAALLGGILQEYQQNYSVLGYAPITLDTPQGPSTVAEVLNDIAGAVNSAQQLAQAENFTTQIRPAFRNARAGENVVFTAAPQGGTPIGKGPDKVPIYTYQWRQDGRPLGQGRSVSLVAQKDALIELEVQDGKNSKARATARLTVTADLSVTLSQAVVKVAPDQSFTVHATARGGKAPYTYAWVSDGKPSSIKSSGLKGTRKKDSTLTVEVRDSDGKTASATCQVQVVLPLKVSLPSKMQVPLGGKFTLKPQIEGGRSPFTFRWYRNGTLLKLSSSEGTGTAKETATIKVEVIDSTGQMVGRSCQVEVQAATAQAPPKPPPPPPTVKEQRFVLTLRVPVNAKEAYLNGEIGLGEEAVLSERVEVVVRGNKLYRNGGKGEQLGTVEGGRVRFRLQVNLSGVQDLDCEGTLGPQGGSGTTRGKYGNGSWKT